MKKFMIVAAVAAMAGAVVAADGYDFTASVKTTKGKGGAQTTTYYVNLGQTVDGIYWWDDQGWDNEKEAKAEVKEWVKDANKNGYVGSDLETFLEGINYTLSTVKDNGLNDYGIKEWYKNKWRWCYSFSFKVKMEDCYRVAGSRKIKGVVLIDQCCDDMGSAEAWEYIALDDVILNDYEEDGVDGYIHPGLLYRFGGLGAKANKVEMAGTMGTDAFDGNINQDQINTFALAGQGSFDMKNLRIANISGNIVGVLENPDCESCCDYNKDASFFACDGFHTEDDDSMTGAEGTAAFGTFSMKYNKKY